MLYKKIRKNDTVKVITGKYKGIVGTVLHVDRKQGRVVVSGVNLQTNYVKQDQQQEGGLVLKEGMISISNVMLYDEVSGVCSRAGFKRNEGDKVLFLKKNGKEVRKL